MSDFRGIVRFVFEMAVLRLLDRSGWLNIGEKKEQLSHHKLRAAQLAFMLAKMEGHENPHYVATMMTFHDIEEVRTGDSNLVAKRYLKINKRQAVEEQTAQLGADIGGSILAMWSEFEERKTPAAIIANDADKLEMAFTARELVTRGNPGAQAWIDDVRARLQTPSAVALFEEMIQSSPDDWWREVTGCW